MTIKTKFNLNDTVYLIHYEQTRTPTPCPDCEGSGELLLLTEKTVPCHRCMRRGTMGITLGEQRWFVKGQLTLGRVNIEIVRETEPDERESEFDNYGAQEASRRETYMAYETGIGSGNNWNAEDLFATNEEATAECERRNAIKEEVPACP